MGDEKLYAAFATHDGHASHVTLDGQVFFASKGLMEELVERMKERYPNVKFELRGVEGA